MSDPVLEEEAGESPVEIDRDDARHYARVLRRVLAARGGPGSMGMVDIGVLKDLVQALDPIIEVVSAAEVAAIMGRGTNGDGAHHHQQFADGAVNFIGNIGIPRVPRAIATSPAQSCLVACPAAQHLVCALVFGHEGDHEAMGGVRWP